MFLGEPATASPKQMGATIRRLIWRDPDQRSELLRGLLHSLSFGVQACCLVAIESDGITANMTGELGRL